MRAWRDLLEPPRRPSGPVVVLPDLFVDHLVPLSEPATALADLADVARRGGGNLHAPGQTLRLGGNAANTAHALGRLGWLARLVAPTDALGRRLAKEALGDLPVDLGGVVDVGRASTTVALELAGADGANVMLSDPGPLAALDPADLLHRELPHLREASLVLVTNWAKVPLGTELLERLVPELAAAGVPVHLDTSDPEPRDLDAARELLAANAVLANLAGWSLNAHEARWFARAVTGRDPGGLVASLRALRRVTPARLDGHDAASGASLEGDDLVEVPSFATAVVARTGAGDAWNAGNLVGTLLGLPAEARLALAHAVAALTISDPGGRPPTAPEVAAFLERQSVEPPL